MTAAADPEDHRRVTGQATFSADVLLPNAAHAVLVGSRIACGRIERIDTTAAARAPGVLLVLTHAVLGELPRGDGHPVAPEARPPLVDDRVRYHGQIIAVVVADTAAQARLAASLLDVRYAAEPPAIAFGDARAPIVPAPGARGAYRHGEFGTAIAEAEACLDLTYTSPIQHAAALEPDAVIAAWKHGELAVYTSSRWIEGDRALLCACLGLAPERVRVIAPFVGGALGAKVVIGWHVVLAALAAIRIGRPVKCVLTRAQVMTTVPHRPSSIQHITLGADRDGRLRAMRHHTVTQSIVEAGYPDPDEYVEATSATSRMLYACPNYLATHELIRLDLMKPGWVRAPGAALGTWALESAMDELACELALDPVELRRRNHAGVRPGDGAPFSSKHLLACYGRAAARFGWARRDPRPGAMRDGDTAIGWGMATATSPAIVLGASVRLRVEHLDGGVLATVAAAGPDLGADAASMMTSVAADLLALPPARVRIERTGRDDVPPSAGGGSSLAAGLAPAIVEAAETIRRQLLAAAARVPNGFPHADRRARDFAFRDGRIAERANGRALTYGELLGATGGVIEATASSPPLTGDRDGFALHSFGAVFVEVRVDPVFGRVAVSRIVADYDVGRVTDPVAALGQLRGGIVFGLGQALFEAAYHDPRTGAPLNPDLTSYLVPVHADLPDVFDVTWLDEPDPQLDALGGRGLGDIGVTGVAAAIANAVFHATGVRVRDLPIVPRLWEHLDRRLSKA